MALYDNIYDVENYFGKPYKELIQFFKNFSGRGILLDIGSGQGRDAIPLAELGYQVTAIDVSKQGIQQIEQKANELNLKIQTKVVDMFNYPIDKDIDIVMLNSILHFEKYDSEKEILLIKRIGNELKKGGVVCICIWKSEENEKLVKSTYRESNSKWEVLSDIYISYSFENEKANHSVDMQYNMYIVRKK